MSIIEYVFYFFFYSFIGWFFESCYCSIRPKKWVNRGFLRGPWCPIYGTGALVILVLLVPLRSITPNLYLNELIIFIVGMVVCDIVEFMTSYIMEKLFNARWWDYSDKRFNIQGRICLTHTMYWGTLSCLFVFVLQPIIDTYLIGQINPDSRDILTYIFITIFVLDLADTVVNALGIRKMSSKLRIITDDITTFTAYVSSLVNIKIDGDNDETKAELQKRYDEHIEAYDKLKNEFETQKSKTKKRLFRLFPFIKEGFQNQHISLEKSISELKEKINNIINK